MVANISSNFSHTAKSIFLLRRRQMTPLIVLLKGEPKKKFRVSQTKNRDFLFASHFELFLCLPRPDGLYVAIVRFYV